jgi:dienelactone hydrolase
MMNPNSLFWYGDSFARRGFIVLAIDISHRPVEDRRGLYGDFLFGDDPNVGNGPRPSIKPPGFDSDWEEDGERVWDALRGLDYLWSRQDVDHNHVLIVGLSIGGEITTFASSYVFCTLIRPFTRS